VAFHAKKANSANPRVRPHQAQFGKLIGIGQTQLSKYQKGQSAPTLEFLVKLKAHSGKSLDWIVSGEEGSRPPVYVERDSTS
jgi:transcriptional regulator with XRE-family HTH domain